MLKVRLKLIATKKADGYEIGEDREVEDNIINISLSNLFDSGWRIKKMEAVELREED